MKAYGLQEIDERATSCQIPDHIDGDPDHEGRAHTL